MVAARQIVLLDVMDTLVHDPFFDEVPRALGLDLEGLYAAKDRDAYIAFEEGRIDEATYAERLFLDRRPVDLGRLHEVLVEGYRWLDGVPELLAELREIGLELHALSNYGPWWRLIEDKLGVSRWVAWSFVSCETGRRKPAPEAFLGAARSLGVAPERCLFVDDRERNCAGARAAGLEAVRFTGAAALRDELATIGLPLGTGC